MARMPRIKIPGRSAGYHVVTRVRGREFLLDTGMKKYFVRLLKRLQQLYYVRYGAFTVLDNHYHLLLAFDDPEDVGAHEAMERWNTYHADTEFVRDPGNEASRDYVVNEVTDVSSFMKRLNYHLTARYNWCHGGSGTLWERRFRSNIIERGWAFVNCAAYIELNAFRASVVTRPEAYRHGGLNYLRCGNSDRLIDIGLLAEGLQLDSELGEKELFHIYKAFVYACGTSPHQDKPNGIIVSDMMRRQLREYELGPDWGSFSTRNRALINGKVTSGLKLARDIYDTHIDPGLEGRRAHEHIRQWIHGLGMYLWSVCSPVMREGP